MRHVLPIAAACAGLALASPTPARAVTLPPDWSAETLPFVFDVPTDLAFLPDGRLLVAEKGGIVYVVDGATRHPLWVHEEEVLNTGDRGLLAIAVDPRFDENRRLYFFFTVDPDSDGVELNNYDDAFGRLVRYEVSASNPNVVDESTRTVLLGATWTDGFASGSETHTVGDLAWGRDGTLLVSAGEGAHFEMIDAGGWDPNLFLPGRTDTLEDVGAFRAQLLASKTGKVLRIDPETGRGLPSNPFWDGDPASNRSRVWAYGLRNPFRITVRPGTGSPDPAAGDPGTILISDVGWLTWEEINVADGPGRNFGWPCFEGIPAHDGYQAATPARADCGTLGTSENPSLPTAPALVAHHGDPGLGSPPGIAAWAIIGGTFADRAPYPRPFVRGYFFGDYPGSWIRVLDLDDAHAVVAVHDFSADADGPVAFVSDPATGEVVYAAIYTGEVHRLRYTGVVSAGPAPRPERLALGPPRPNPARGEAAFTVELAAAGRVAFEIVDVAGRIVWREAPRELAAGRATLAWPGRTRAGEPAPAGVYVARVVAGGDAARRRFVLVR